MVKQMAEPTRADDGGGELIATAEPDVLRVAFGQAIAALVTALPAGVERDMSASALKEDRTSTTLMAPARIGMQI
jgi:hypothetical protein